MADQFTPPADAGAVLAAACAGGATGAAAGSTETVGAGVADPEPTHAGSARCRRRPGPRTATRRLAR
jgi:hypothetical protein